MKLPKKPCHIHPKYQAMQQPRAACPYCWRQYLAWNDNVEVDSHTLAKVIHSLLLTSFWEE